MESENENEHTASSGLDDPPCSPNVSARPTDFDSYIEFRGVLASSDQIYLSGYARAYAEEYFNKGDFGASAVISELIERTDEAYSNTTGVTRSEYDVNEYAEFVKSMMRGDIA